jgi:5-methylcytosine-specific restriction endonuclease McrA
MKKTSRNNACILHSTETRKYVQYEASVASLNSILLSVDLARSSRPWPCLELRCRMEQFGIGHPFTSPVCSGSSSTRSAHWQLTADLVVLTKSNSGGLTFFEPWIHPQVQPRLPTRCAPHRQSASLPSVAIGAQRREYGVR